MKELTIEEKAKAYDKTLERANSLLSDNQLGNAWIYKLLPELKDDDKEIRKELISMCQTLGKTEWIAWLEKQGDKQKLDGTFVNIDDVREDFVNEVYRVLDADSTNDRANQIIDAFDNLPTVTIEKQGGQKPYGLREECKDCQCNYAGECKGSCAMKRNEQKPWSEEDKKMIDTIIETIKMSIEDCDVDDVGTKARFSLEKEREWLKTLKDRVQPQPSQEWSEEDESMRTRCIGILGKCYMGELPTKVEEELNWLKSLGPQKQWKPSEAQVVVVDDIIRNGHLSNANERIMCGLLEQLKKLKE